MKRILVALMAGAAVFTIAFASAAALDVRGETIQAGTDINLACDTNGVDANWGLERSDNTVRNVRISDIATECFGAEMWVRVNGVDYPGIVIDSNSETFAFSAPYPSPESINDLKVWIEG